MTRSRDLRWEDTYENLAITTTNVTSMNIGVSLAVYADCCLVHICFYNAKWTKYAEVDNHFTCVNGQEKSAEK